MTSTLKLSWLKSNAGIQSERNSGRMIRFACGLMLTPNVALTKVVEALARVDAMTVERDAATAALLYVRSTLDQEEGRTSVASMRRPIWTSRCSWGVNSSKR